MSFTRFSTITCFFGTLLLLLLLSGCSGFFSGYREVPISQNSMTELTQFMNSEFAFAIPRVNDQEPGRIVFVMGFDGTNNDRDQVPEGETKTVVAQLFDGVEGNELGKPVEYPDSPVLKSYLRGPGCADSWWCLLDQATGRSSPDTANEAFHQLQTFIAAHPSATEVRVVVIGFSRGAATARHFLNQVYNASTAGKLETKAPVWSSAILIETVATGQTEKLMLGMPPNLEFGLHLVAKNETRTLFPPIIDNDQSYQSYARNRSPYYFKRLYTVYLPGAHSDLGDSYRTGSGPAVTAVATNVIENMGLRKACLNDCRKNAPIRLVNDGLHDSRGLLDRMLGAVSPYSKGFQRTGALTVDSLIEKKDAARLFAHMEHELKKYQFGVGTLSSFRMHDNYLFIRHQGQSEWQQVRSEGQTGAKVENRDGTASILFSIASSKPLAFPESVVHAVESESGEVVLEVTPFNGEWHWFVNGYIPGDQ